MYKKSAVLGLLAGFSLLATSFVGHSEEDLETRVKRLEQILGQQQDKLEQQSLEIQKRDRRIGELETVFNDQKMASQIERRAYFSPTGKADAGDDSVIVTFDKGLRFKTGDGQHKVALGGRILQDWSWSGFSGQLKRAGKNSEDAVENRSARLYMSGTYYKNLFWKWNFDFEDDGVETKDLYMGIQNLPYVGSWRVGHFNEPFSIEQISSSKYNTFMERALPNVFAPGRNAGMMFDNSVLDDRMTWAVGVFRDDADAADAPATTFVREDDGYNVTGRVTGTPYFKDDGEHMVHLGLAYSMRNPNDNRRRFRTRPEVHTNAFRLADTGTFNAEQEDRVGAELAWVWGPASLQGEYMASWVDRDQGADLTAGPPAVNFENTFMSGGYAQFSYWVTGEHRKYDPKTGTFGRVSPKKNFWDGKDSLGAIELAVRYSYLDLNSNDVDGGIMNGFTAGVNWHLNPNTRIMLNYVYTTLDQGLVTDDIVANHNGLAPPLFQVNGSQNTFQMRFQIDF